MFVKRNLTFGLICAAIGFRIPLSYQGQRGSYRGRSMYSARQRTADADRAAAGAWRVEQSPSVLPAGFVQASRPLGNVGRDRLHDYNRTLALLL